MDTAGTASMRLPTAATNDFLVAAIKGRALYVYAASAMRDHSPLQVLDLTGQPVFDVIAGGAPGRYGTSIAPGNGLKSDVFAVRVAAFAAEPHLVLDADGFYHLAYVDPQNDRLIVINNRAGKWLRSVVDDGDSFGAISLVVDADGAEHLAYERFTDNVIRYATNADPNWPSPGTPIQNKWRIETVAEQLVALPALALDQFNQPHVAYFKYQPETVQYAHKVDGLWQSLKIGFKPGYTQPGIGVDDNGKVHVVYIRVISFPFKGFPSTVHLMHATDKIGIWTNVPLVQDGSLDSLAMTLDSRGDYHVVASGYQVHYFSNREANASLPALIEDLDGDSCALALDAAEDPLVAYHDEDAGVLRAAIGKDGTWTTATLDAAVDAGRRCDLAIDDTGNLHASYLSDSTGMLYYTTNGGDGWASEAIELTWTSYDAPESSIAIDKDGYAHISVSNREDYDLHYLTNRSGTWESTVVADYAISLWNSIALDDDGYAHIVYSDTADYNIVHLTNRSGEWVSEIVSQHGYTPIYPEIACDADGVLHVAYLAEGNVMYATDASGGWETTILKTLNDCNLENIDLALDANGNAHVAMSTSFEPTGTKVRLRYFENTTGSWTEQVVLTQNDNQRIDYLGLGVDSAGAAHISFCDNYSFHSDGGDLAYVTNASGSWEKTTLDEVGRLGSYSDLAIDGDDNVHIIHYGDNALYYVGLMH